MIFTGSLKLDIVGIIVGLCMIFLTWMKWHLSYWKRQGVTGPEPSLIVGNMKEFFMGKKTMGESFRDMYSNYKLQSHRYIGAFFMAQSTFVPIDLELIKSILQTDFQHFSSHGGYHNEDVDPLSVNIFNLEGTRWRDIRAKLTPTFTSGKIKMMHQILIENTKILCDVLHHDSKLGPLDIKDIFARYTTDNIASCAFGLNVSSLTNPNTEFRVVGSQIFEQSLVNMARTSLSIFIPHNILSIFNYSQVSKYVRDFFYKSVVSTIKYREENKILRPDFLNMMIELKNDDSKRGGLTINEIASQCFLFFIAGFETSASASTFACYELAVNQQVQDRLREEINSVLIKYNGEVTYEALMEMEYLDRVLQETLRKRPPVSILLRKCTKDYKIPGESLVIKEGTSVMLPVLGIHYDPEYYPDPDKFDPDRFTEENKHSRPPLTWLPFGEGPRNCIGLRFGTIQTKVALLTLIRNYKINLNIKTVTPLVYSKKGLFDSVEGGVWLDLQKT